MTITTQTSVPIITPALGDLPAKKAMVGLPLAVRRPIAVTQPLSRLNRLEVGLVGGGQRVVPDSTPGQPLFRLRRLWPALLPLN